MLIRHRSQLTNAVEVSHEQTPKWFIGLDGTTYSKVEWELAPPPGTWQDITNDIVYDVKDGAAQGRVNFYYREDPSHAIRIGYLQCKGAYRVVQTPQGLRVERRVDDGNAT